MPVLVCVQLRNMLWIMQICLIKYCWPSLLSNIGWKVKEEIVASLSHYKSNFIQAVTENVGYEKEILQPIIIFSVFLINISSFVSLLLLPFFFLNLFFFYIFSFLLEILTVPSTKVAISYGTQLFCFCFCFLRLVIITNRNISIRFFHPSMISTLRSHF